MYSKKILFPIAALAVALTATSTLIAQEHGANVKNYLAEDVIAVGYADLSAIHSESIVDVFQQLGVEGSELVQIKASVEFAEQQATALTNAGLKDVYLLARASDINHKGTTLILPVADGKDAHQALQQLKTLVGAMPGLLENFKVDGNVIIAAKTQSQIDSLSAGGDRIPTEAWKCLGSGAAGLIVVGDSDSRMIVKQMMPQFPAPFESLTGALVADDLEWGGIQINILPKLNLKLEVAASDAESAEATKKAISRGIKNLSQLPEFQQQFAENAEAAATAMQPKIDGKLVKIEIDNKVFSTVLSGPIRQARIAARESQEINSLRQLGLAMLNYESAHGQFPAPDGKSETRPAGLSWRIYVLPYMNQMDLYKQFKLDEPWDSAHNKTLISKMPAIFKSPFPEAADQNLAGKTTFQMVVGDQAYFQNGKNQQYENITDGTSNSIMGVVVAPSEAAVWTKPDDWEVDLENPLEGLKWENRETFSAVFGDCSTHRIKLSVNPETLKLLLMPADGEVVPRDWQK